MHPSDAYLRLAEGPEDLLGNQLSLTRRLLTLFVALVLFSGTSLFATAALDLDHGLIGKALASTGKASHDGRDDDDNSGPGGGGDDDDDDEADDNRGSGRRHEQRHDRRRRVALGRQRRRRQRLEHAPGRTSGSRTTTRTRTRTATARPTRAMASR